MGLLDLYAALSRSPLGGLLGSGDPASRPLGRSEVAWGPGPAAVPLPASDPSWTLGPEAIQPIAQGGGDLFSSVEARYGLPAGYLGRTAQIESGGNPNARNPGSSAAGLFQFIDSTAAAYGLDNPLDPVASTDAAARLGADNAAALRRVLGREPTAAELYLAHQQGAGGASRLLANPNARAADIVGADAVRLNGGSPDMTAGEFAGLWLSKFDRAPQNMASPQPARNGGVSQSTSTGSTSPMGLLSMPPEPERRASVWDRAEGVPGVGLLADPERRARLLIAMQGLTMRPNQGLVAMAQGDIADARDREKQQRLAAWLGSQDNPTAQNLGAMLAAGVPDGMAGTLLGAMQPPEAPRPIVTDGGLVLDPTTGAVIADHRQGTAAPSYMTGAEVAQMFPGVQVQDPNALFAMGTDGIPKPVEGTGAPDPSTAPQARTAQGPDGVLRWVDGPQAGQPVFPGVATPAADTPGANGLTPAETLDAERNQRQEWEALPEVKTFAGVASAYSNIVASAQQGTASGDVALITGLQKLLDPNSVVREQEFATAANVGGLLEKLQAAAQQLESGELLTGDQRAQIVDAATAIYREAEQRQGRVYRTREGIAERAGLNPENVLTDYSYSPTYTGRVPFAPVVRPQARPSQPAVAPAPAATEPAPPPPPGAVNPVTGQPITPEEWAAAWAKMTPEQRRAFQ